MPKVNVNGELFYYEERGEVGKGTTLLLVHGAAGTSSQWEDILEDLGREHRVIALDLPGHGNSTGRGGRTVGTYLKAVKAFTETIHLSPFVFCGHSMGGAIGIEYALKYPEDLLGLTLISSGGRLRVSPLFLEICLEGDQDKIQILLTKYAYAPTVSLVDVQKLHKKWGFPSMQVSYGDFLACDNFDRLKDLPDINVPTLVVCGDEDQMTPVKYSEYLAKHISNSYLEVIHGGGHMLMVEKSLELREILQKFAQDRLQDIVNSE